MVCKIQDWENSSWNHIYHLMSKSFPLTGKRPQSCEAGIKDGFKEMKIVISDWNIPSRNQDFGCFPFRKKKSGNFGWNSLGISMWEKVVPFHIANPGTAHVT